MLHPWTWLKLWPARILLTGAILVPSVSQHAYAEDKVFFSSSGDGRSSCGDYLTASQGLDANMLKKMTRDQRVFLSENAAYDQWIFGFLSARNYASAQQGNKRPDVPFRQAEAVAWIREWCGTRPNTPVLEAALSFMRDRWGNAQPNVAASPPVSPQPSPPRQPAPTIQAAAPQAATANVTFVFVTFKPNLSNDDLTAFLQAYKVSIEEGPNAGGFYKLRLADPIPSDQLQPLLDSMKGQPRIVSNAAAG